MATKKKKKPAKAKKKLKKRVVRKVGKKAPKKKQAKKKTLIKKPKAKKENVIGLITHYFPHVQAAVIKLKTPLAIGDTIRIKGHTTDFTQTINSMQIDHVPITKAKKGDEIGLLVESRVRQHDRVVKP
jgi:putative protease